MYQLVNEYQFQQAFFDLNRSNQFTPMGLQALFDYLEEYEDNTGEKVELDVIALCCEYTEYKDLKEFQDNYDPNVFQSIRDIEEHTTVIKIDDESFIIQDF